MIKTNKTSVSFKHRNNYKHLKGANELTSLAQQIAGTVLGDDELPAA